MKNTIYAGTETTVTVPVSNVVPLTITDKRYNRNGANSNIDRVANAIAINTCGRGCRPRYNIRANVTFTVTEAGNAAISLYQDGVEIPLSKVVSTVSTADTIYVTLETFASILTNCCGTSAITIVNTGEVSMNVITSSILVEEV